MGRVARAAIALLVVGVIVEAGVLSSRERVVAAQQLTPTRENPDQGRNSIIGDGEWALITAFVGVVGSLGGVWFGHQLSAGEARKRESAHEAKLRMNVRTLIHIEINQNLRTLQDLWSEIKNSKDESEEAERLSSEVLARRFIARPVPAWSRLMWESQAAAIPMALSVEEIGKVYRHYENLVMLAEYQRRLLQVRAADQERPAEETQDFRGRIVRFPPPSYFPVEVKYIWPEAERVVTDTLNIGNPIISF